MTQVAMLANGNIFMDTSMPPLKSYYTVVTHPGAKKMAFGFIIIWKH